MAIVKVLVIRIDDFQASEVENLLKYVSVTKQKRFSKRKLFKNNLLSIIGEIGLRLIVQEEYGIRYDNISLIYNKNGKPKIENYNHIKFNISHSNDVVAIALSSECNIGIDIEKIKSFSKNVVGKFFSHDEKRMIDRLSIEEKNYAFYRLWTMKESFIKANGEGIFNTNLSNVSMVKVFRDEFVYKERFSNNYFKVNSIYEDYISTLCSDVPIRRIDTIHSDLNEITKNKSLIRIFT